LTSTAQTDLALGVGQLLEEARRLEAAIAAVAQDTQKLFAVKADASIVTLLQRDLTDLAHVQACAASPPHG
jgi:hypothetical protein